MWKNQTPSFLNFYLTFMVAFGDALCKRCRGLSRQLSRQEEIFINVYYYYEYNLHPTAELVWHELHSSAFALYL